VLPALVLLIAAETAVRVMGLDAPTLRNVGLPEERVGLIRLDGELFWGCGPEST